MGMGEDHLPGAAEASAGQRPVGVPLRRIVTVCFCPERNTPHLHERCDLICPDLPKVL
jgi:hypothetical protein